MTGHELPPLAPSLMESLRSLGYTVEAALADVIDNSVAASADLVKIEFSAHPEPYVAIVDNGEGMDEATLVEAMRFGSRDPRAQRTGKDLGRFGLGMKTASLSQCRQLTVLSRRCGKITTAEWDLDACERRNSWWLSRPDPAGELLPYAEQLKALGSGTIILWRKLDRLVPVGRTERESALDAALSAVGDHLAFTFHRFISGREGDQLRITVNGRDIPSLDPFLEGHPRGQTLYEEAFCIDGKTVRVTPFVLPFPSKLSASDRSKAGGSDRIKSGHGFYVYRGKRLVVPGGWFRIVPTDELVRLARIRVDVPVELDHLWKVDIRKTAVEPPRELRDNLRRIVGDAARRSRKVYQFRGSAGRDGKYKPLWIRKVLRDDAVTWTIDREHPTVKTFATGEPADLERLFRLIEDAVPFQDIYVHMSGDRNVGPQSDAGEQREQFEELASRILRAFEGSVASRQTFLENLHTIEPFSRDPDTARHVAVSLMERHNNGT